MQVSRVPPVQNKGRGERRGKQKGERDEKRIPWGHPWVHQLTPIVGNVELWYFEPGEIKRV